MLTLVSILNIIEVTIGGETMDHHRSLLVLQSFGKLTHQLFQTIAKKGKQSDLTPESPFLLHIIDKSQPITQKDIASRMGIRPATLTVRLQRLEKLKLITRSNDPEDKRVQYVSITPKGHEMVMECYRLLEEVSEEAFKGFREDEIIQMFDYIQRIKQNIEK